MTRGRFGGGGGGHVPPLPPPPGSGTALKLVDYLFIQMDKPL